jgi:hypothetical protein
MGTDETHEPKRVSARLGLSSPFIFCICLGAVLLRSAVAKKSCSASIEADFDLAKVEPLLALVVGDEVFLGQALMRQPGVVLIDKDGFHHAGGTQDFDVLRGRAADLFSADRNRLWHLTPAPHLAVAIP